MSEAYKTLITRTHAWFDHAHADGWLSAADLQRLAAVEERTPADLFAGTQRRPLVVALFGGTGVGKSSLLNRLAGEELARTGVERPTSREVTIYLHESIELAALPPEMPVEHVRVKRHRDDSRRDVLWIDAPDIDSALQTNREYALAWLPHVDLVLYVVSPERYRDDVGWQVLRQRGNRHGWIFVLNRWDEGDATQKRDFAGMLHNAGFGAPLLLCTCCAPHAARLPTPDQFNEIEAAIQALLAEHGVRELERLGHRARLLEIRDTLTEARKRLGDDEQWRKVGAAAERHWQQTRTALLQGLEWPIRDAAGRFAVRNPGLLGRAVRQAVLAAKESGRAPESPAASTGAAPPRRETGGADGLDNDTAAVTRQLWDAWTQDKLLECLDAVEVELRRTDLAPAPARGRLDLAAEQAGRLVVRAIQDRLRAALAQPGTRLQRALRRVTGFLMTALPLLALAWVAFNVIEGYQRASAGTGPWLGSDFAVSSVMLVIVVWAVPFACDRLLRPSLERTALHAMRLGLAEGLDQLGEHVRAAVTEAAQKARAVRDDATVIIGEVSRLALQPVGAAKASLSRLLATPPHAAAPAAS